MEDYQNLKSALSLFQEECGLDNEQVFSFLRKAISKKQINISKLKEEYKHALKSDRTDWQQIAFETHLLIEPELYSSQEIAEYTKEWLWEFLYPENVPDQSFLSDVRKEVLEILGHQGGDWIDAIDLYNWLKKQYKYKSLQYYQLWYLDFNACGIERKEISGKDRAIGYLRLKE